MSKLLIKIILLTLAFFSLGGCSASKVRQAEPIEVTIPDLPKEATQPITAKEIDHSPRHRQEFLSAVEDLKSGQTESATKQLESLAEEDVRLAGVYLNLALINYRKKNYPESKEQTQRALTLSPRNAIAYNLNGLLFMHEADFRNARLEFAKALKIDPDYARAHLNMGILFDIYFQYWQDAISHYQRYKQLTPDYDKKIDHWIQDLQYRIQMADQTS